MPYLDCGDSSFKTHVNRFLGEIKAEFGVEEYRSLFKSLLRLSKNKRPPVLFLPNLSLLPRSDLTSDLEQTLDVDSNRPMDDAENNNFNPDESVGEDLELSQNVFTFGRKKNYYDHYDDDDDDFVPESKDGLFCQNVLKKRRRRMNKMKFRKRLKRDRRKIDKNKK